jgi:outer membrane protein OmpA-like peptidoglycan-associated protein
MRTGNFFALVGIFSVLMAAAQPTKVFSHDQIRIDEPQNYVVIGAFSVHKNAIRFTSHAHRDLHMNARFEMNKSRNLYYVYVLNTPDRSQAINMANKLRSETEFTDTWVYSGSLGQESPAGQTSQRGTDINPETEQHIEHVPSNEQKEDQQIAPPAEELQPSVQAMQEASKEKESEQPADAAVIDNGIEGKNFFFRIFRATDNEIVEGDVNAIDTKRSRKIASYKGNTAVKIPQPSDKAGNMALTCEVFGYRKVQRDVDYNNPQGEGIEIDEQGRIVVPFDLVRLQKGDIAVMYNVYFFKDAGIMRPESRYEVGSLLEMLKENEKYKIRIHGHTNGGASGKVISMAKGSTNFFALTDTKEGFGSAKELSEERAEVIRDYLVSNGVDAQRMEIKAWGGKKPIHDKHSSRAQENVRVEIEILEN